MKKKNWQIRRPIINSVKKKKKNCIYFTQYLCFNIIYFFVNALNPVILSYRSITCIVVVIAIVISENIIPVDLILNTWIKASFRKLQLRIMARQNWKTQYYHQKITITNSKVFWKIKTDNYIPVVNWELIAITKTIDHNKVKCMCS